MASLNQPPSGSVYRNANAPYQMLRVLATGIPSMSLNVIEGGYWVNNEAYVEFIGGPTPAAVAPTVVDTAYWMVTVLNQYGQVELLYGEAVANNPQLPTIPYNDLPLAAVLINASCTQITQDMINDVRPVFYTGYPRLSHSELLNTDSSDLHPMAAITGLSAALATKIDMATAIELVGDKLDKTGTPAEEFILNMDQAGVPASNVYLSINRGAQPKVGIRYNETYDCWQFTNNGIDWLNIQGGVSIVDASSTNKGFAYLSVDPSDPVSPTAVGINDPRLFTESEKTAVNNHLINMQDPHKTLKIDCIITDYIKNGVITTDKLADLAVDQTKLAEGSVTGSKVAPNAIDNSKLADNCIDNAKITDLSVTEGKISNGSVTGAKLAPGSVGASNLIDGAVDTNKLADISVTTTKIVNSSVITAKLADLAVTTAKLANSSVDSTKLCSCACTTDKISDLAITTVKLDEGSVTMSKLGTDVVTLLNSKLDSALVSAKADVAYVPTTPSEWSTAPTTIYMGLDTLAHDLYSKANITDVAIKADKTYVDSMLENKTEKTYVDAALALKSDTTYVDSQLANKADKTYVDNSLLLKADVATVGAYTPADGTKWTAPAPTTIVEAIERLLNSVFTLKGATV